MNDSNRREHPRLSHPFDARRLGILDTPLQLYDLSVGGCFINHFHDPPPHGKIFALQIELPDGPITVRSEVIYARLGFGYAVRFLELSDEARAAIDSALARLRDERDSSP